MLQPICFIKCKVLRSNSTSNTTDNYLISLTINIIKLFHYTSMKEINDNLNNIDQNKRDTIVKNIKKLSLKENPENLYEYKNFLILGIIDENDIKNNLDENEILTNINNKVEKLLGKITSYD